MLAATPVLPFPLPKLWSCGHVGFSFVALPAHLMVLSVRAFSVLNSRLPPHAVAVTCKMTVTMTIPDDLSRELSVKFNNLSQAALEALACEAYENDVLSLEQVRRMLDLPSRWEAQAVLSSHGVWPGTTAEDFRSDLETLIDLRPSD